MVKQSPDGVIIFAVRCLLCHGPGGRAIQLESLAKLKPEAVYFALSTGVMRQQAAGLEEADLRTLTNYLASLLERRDRLATTGSCPEEDRENRSAVGSGEWNGWSPDVRNTHFQPSEAAGLSFEDIHRLRLKWAFVFPDVATAANQPTIVGGRLHIGSWDGTVYAFEARSGCVYWTFKADPGVCTAVTIAGGLALFGDFLANVYAVDTSTGKLRWRKEVDPHPQARITGSPVAHRGCLYLPLSSIEEGVADARAYQCCTFRGSVVVPEISSGRRIWKTYTIDEAAQEIGVNPVGISRFGPSGVAIWSVPTVDAKRNLLFVATGNNYTDPDVAATDAVIALELQTGTKRWVRSLLPSDRWNAACLSANRANCPPEEGPHFDFGASPVLVRLWNGFGLLLAGQKSGVLSALDPAQGTVRWEVRLGRGGSLGGIEWGMAVGAGVAYVAVAGWNVGSTEADGALSAVDLETGKRIWRTPNPFDACQKQHIPVRLLMPLR